MFKVFLFSFIGLFMAAGSSFASESTPSTNSTKPIIQIDQELQDLAAEYYLDQIMINQINELLGGDFSTLRRRRPPVDFAKPGGLERCQSMICSTLGESHCRFQRDRDQAKLLCQNQYDETCMQNWCTIPVGQPCRFMSDFDKAAQACGEVGGPCVKSICQRLGSSACRMSSDINKVASVCRGFYDSSCIDAVCAKRPSQECKSLRRLEEVALACTLQQNPQAEEIKN